MVISDEVLLNCLNEHPGLRGRVESMLLVVDDETGSLHEADAAEMRPVEEWNSLPMTTANLAPIPRA